MVQGGISRRPSGITDNQSLYIHIWNAPAPSSPVCIHMWQYVRRSVRWPPASRTVAPFSCKSLYCLLKGCETTCRLRQMIFCTALPPNYTKLGISTPNLRTQGLLRRIRTNLLTRIRQRDSCSATGRSYIFRCQERQHSMHTFPSKRLTCARRFAGHMGCMKDNTWN